MCFVFDTLFVIVACVVVAGSVPVLCVLFLSDSLYVFVALLLLLFVFCFCLFACVRGV